MFFCCLVNSWTCLISLVDFGLSVLCQHKLRVILFSRKSFHFKVSVYMSASDQAVCLPTGQASGRVSEVRGDVPPQQSAGR